MAIPIEVRFWSKVTLSEGCWEWAAACDGAGYGSIGIDTGGTWKDWKIVKTHRWMWEFIHGPIPGDLFVLHKCDNRKCVRPDHLFLGTHLDNSNDKIAKGRDVILKGTTNGRAKLTEADVLAIRAAHTYVPGKRNGAVARLACQYGVSESMISDIVRRKNWKHL
jgi:hypothetical protein